jgi:hypothetical protein
MPPHPSKGQPLNPPRPTTPYKPQPPHQPLPPKNGPHKAVKKSNPNEHPSTHFFQEHCFPIVGEEDGRRIMFDDTKPPLFC